MQCKVFSKNQSIRGTSLAMITLSIIVPVYNAEKYLSRCLDSILSQTFEDFEVVLVDDGSSDSSLDICLDYAKKDTRVKVIHTENQGAGLARNTGLDSMSPESEFVAFVDADDWTYPELYEKMLAAFTDDVDISVCDFTMVSNDGNVDYKTFCAGINAQESISNMLQDGYGGNPWNKIIRKSLIEKAGLRFREYVTAQDFLFIAECFAVCRKAVNVSEPLYYYNMLNTGSITASIAKTERKEKAYLEVFSELKDFYNKVGWGNVFDKELCWRVQLLKSDWVLLSEKYDKYCNTWPDGDKYLLSNPFIHRKMKVAMWMLNHHMTLPLRLCAILLKKR